MKLRFGWQLAWLSGNGFGYIACQPSISDVDPHKTFEKIDIPPHFPEWPSSSPMGTSAQIELGRWLFYDRRLSLDASRSCGICHEQAKGFSDGLGLALGIDNTLLPLNSPSLVNIAWRTELTWNRKFQTIEEQMHIPLFAQDPLEMGMDEALILERISAFPVYVDMFDEAFPEDTSPISTDNTIYAIAAFTRTIIAGNSKYDRWLMGEEELTETEEHGRQLFFSDRLQCGFCHGGIFFDQPVPEHTGVTQRHGYFNTGLYDIDDQGGYPITAQGMIETTGIASDMGKFRVPTLRNLAYTYPWMHDGSEISLYNIIANYARGGRLISSGLNSGDGRDNPYKSDLISGFDITDIEIEQVLSFLKTLEDPLLQTNINLLSPFCIEQEGENIYEPCEPPFTID